MRVQVRPVHLFATLAMLALAACSAPSQTLPIAQQQMTAGAQTPDYLIGPGDNLSIFVWRNPDLSMVVPVRPDGRLSVPLIEDLQAAGKTPTALARDIEGVLKQYVQDPIVTVIITGFNGPFAQQVRVVGEAARPQAIPYRDNMTVLDLMIQVGGLTQFAAGNRAVLVRGGTGQEQQFRVYLDDLIKDGKVGANVGVLPGDILIIPQSWF